VGGTSAAQVAYRDDLAHPALVVDAVAVAHQPDRLRPGEQADDDR
jgi:hypothetical protein